MRRTTYAAQDARSDEDFSPFPYVASPLAAPPLIAPPPEGTTSAQSRWASRMAAAGRFPPDGGGTVELFRQVRRRPPSVGLTVAAGQSVAARPPPPPPPPNPSCMVHSGRLLGCCWGRSTVAVAGGRSSRLPQGRSDKPLVWGSWAAPSRRCCVVLASSPRGGPHGGGDGEPWASGVAHPRGGVRRGWHGGVVSLTAWPDAPPLAPPSARD
jgi:hypothetical protein